MIKYIPSFLTSDEINYFMDIFYSENMNYFGDDVYKFYYVNLMNKTLEVNKFSKFFFKKFRVQMINETINQIETYHTHLTPWSFIIFLNEDFTGGEVFFDDVEYKPKKGDMLYFSGEERHRVNNCIGNRYTLIGFMLNNPLEIDVKRNLI
jgi:hypothetical protein